MCSYCKRHTESEVPDPCYGGPQGFEKVSSMLCFLLSNKFATTFSILRDEILSQGQLSMNAVFPQHVPVLGS